MSSSPRLRDLLFQRSELKGAGRFREAIPFQLEIIELLEAERTTQNQLAGAHNMASVLYLRSKLYSSAEWHARRALALHVGDSVKDHEAFGTYNLVLAQILACRFEFDEAADYGQKAIAEFSIFHSPSDEFLERVLAEVESMRNKTWTPRE